MFRLSKQPPVMKTINGHKYKMTKWASCTTNMEGFRILKIIAPSATMMGELLNSKTSFEQELEAIYQDPSDKVYAMTGAVHQLAAALGDEYYMQLVDKLLSNLKIHNPETDEYEVIEDWSDHCDIKEFQQDFEQLVVWSIKENILDFFMSQPTILSLLGKVSKVVTPMIQSLTDQMQKSTKDN